MVVLMLGYMIIYYIKRYWREEETVGELSTISEDVVSVGGKKISRTLKLIIFTKLD